MRILSLSLVGLLLLSACGGEENTGAPSATEPRVQPEHIAVDHILIGVTPAIPNGRSVAEASELAYALLEQLREGADWATLKNEHSQDRQAGRPPGGPYGMSNRGIRPNPGERARDGMVPAFGDVGFELEVGEIGMADYDPQRSRWGFHIIKRGK